MSIKTFDVMSFNKTKLIDPEQVGYQDSIEIIHEELQKTRKSFIKIGWYLKHIHINKMYEQDGYANIYEFAMDKFHISQPTATRFMNICEEFSINHNSPELDKKYEDYNISQLFEMLSMSKDKLEQITPKMTVKQIRELKKDMNKIDDDSIPGQTSIEANFPEYLPEEYATTHNVEEKNTFSKEQIIDGECQEIRDPGEKNSPEDNLKPTDELSMVKNQPEFPVLKNADQRKEWLAKYKDWGLWYRDENIDVNYYKYDFPDGSRLVVTEYPKRHSYWSDSLEDEYYFHLLQKNKKGYKKTYDELYRHKEDSETYLIEYLKELQKGGR